MSRDKVHVKYRKIYTADLKYDDKVGSNIPPTAYAGPVECAYTASLVMAPAVPGARHLRRRAQGDVAGQECGGEDVLLCREEGRLLRGGERRGC